MKPITVDMPYPNFEGVEKNLSYAKIIAPLYASAHGELQAILSYSYSSLYFENFFDKDISKTLVSISLAEMEHLKILGNILLRLGHDPIYAYPMPFGYENYSTANLTYSKTPQKIILDAITGELVAINDYLKAAQSIDDDAVSATLLRIRLDEELHVKVLREELKKIRLK